MKNKVIVVLIPTDYHNSRKVCEHIENMRFLDINAISEHLWKELEIDEDNHPLIYPITDFMDEVNDQLLDDLGNYFISYVEIV